MKFMHIADVHLGVIPDKGKPWSDIRAREVQESFSRVLRVAKKEKVDLLLIAGDLFHYPPTTSMLKEVDAMLSDIPNMTTIIIAGNHDYMTVASPYARYEFESDTVVLPCYHAKQDAEQMIFDDLKVCVTGISYDCQQITEAIYDDLEPNKEFSNYLQILLAHGGDAKHCPIDYDRLRQAGFDYIALGHIHKPEILVQDQMVYVGSLEPIDVTDTGKRGYLLGEVTDEHTVRTKWIPFSCRRYEDLFITMEETWTNHQLVKMIKEQIETIGEEHIYRIFLRGPKSLDMEFDISSIMNQYYVSEVVDESYEAFDYDMLRRENADNLLGQYIDRMKTDDMSDVELKALEYGVKALLRYRGA